MPVSLHKWLKFLWSLNFSSSQKVLKGSWKLKLAWCINRVMSCICCRLKSMGMKSTVKIHLNSHAIPSLKSMGLRGFFIYQKWKFLIKCLIHLDVKGIGTYFKVRNRVQPWLDSSVRAVPIHQGFFIPHPGHIRESTSECMGEWDKKLIFLPLKSTYKGLTTKFNQDTKLCIIQIQIKRTLGFFFFLVIGELGFVWHRRTSDCGSIPQHRSNEL